LLDHTATQQYRARIAELTDRIDTFESRDQSARAAEAIAERDWLLSELAAATGLARRARTFSHEHERARLSVSKAIHRTLTAITRADPAIGAHLSRCIGTGNHCSYRPQ
jgi:inorganic triphosphatase YgiF